ncbi:MAG: glycosyltransferase [Candidatus Paceibacterota bacterium]|jgi:glycosyltransferase involved in cell wall biosynthesis
MKKKILFVITKSNWGGAQRYVYDLATNLPKEQFEIVVAFGGTGGADASSGLLAERLTASSVRTIFLTSFTRDIYLFREFKAFFELLNVIKKEKPDVLHLNSSKAGGIGTLAGRIAGIRKIIFTAHGFAHNEMRPLYQRALIWIASWLTILFAHRVVVLSNYELKRAPVIFTRRKFIVIHNGIDPHMSFGSGEKIRNSFPLGTCITGTVGELTKNKNQISLIEQSRNNPDMFIAIVGEGEERARLESKIKEYGLGSRVKLFGFIPANEVLRGFDMFALPSLKEGLPYVLLEAKAAGLPIVANRVGGVGEILDAKDMSDFSLARMVQRTKDLYLAR